MPNQDIQARNYVIACFAVSLVRGETLKGRHIRHATIRNYVAAACALHRDRDLPSPYGAPRDYITIVLRAVQKYEKVKNRREMINDEMIYAMAARASTYKTDSREDALLDWLYLGRFTGYRTIEWCQKTMQAYEKITHPNWQGPSSYAFIAEDLIFYNTDKVHITDISAVTIDDVLYVYVRYRKQKNNQNGEVIPYYKDNTNPAFCPVRAALRIAQRAIRLRIPNDEPLACFMGDSGKYKGQRCFITNNCVATYLQSIAKMVYKLKPGDAGLKRWTGHSIRVTACNLLHRQGFSDSYIQTRLRWKSTAFQDYLRNTLYSAAAHTKALNIPLNNLPTLTNAMGPVTLQNGAVVLENSPTGLPLPRFRGREEIEEVLHAGAA